MQEVIFCDVSPVAMFDIDNLLNFTDTIADQEETLEKMFERSKFPYIICEPHQHSSSSSLVARILSFLVIIHTPLFRLFLTFVTFWGIFFTLSTQAENNVAKNLGHDCAQKVQNCQFWEFSDVFNNY